MKIIEQFGDGADRRRKRIRAIERYIRRAGENGLSIDEIKTIGEYQLGLTGKKIGEIVKILRKLGKVHLNEKRRYTSL